MVDFDITGLFDNIRHDSLIEMVKRHTERQWVILYIERWLNTPFEMQDGTIVERIAGTPQGGVISPVLANLFMHYVFDDFMSKEYPYIPWVRYADDGAINCVSVKQAKYIVKVLDKRFKTFGLELNLEKTKIIYCKDDNRKGEYENIKFDFLGYTFRKRVARKKNGELFTSLLPAISDKAQKSINRTVRDWRLQDKCNKNLAEIGRIINPKIQGWINYYAKYYKTEMYKVLRYINYCLLKWVRRKFKKIHSRKQATKWLDKVAKSNTDLFSHWKFGVTPTAR